MKRELVFTKKLSSWCIKVGIGVLVVLAISLFGCVTAKKKNEKVLTVADLIKVNTKQQNIYNDEFAKKISLAATYITPFLAEELIRQKVIDFKSINPNIGEEKKLRENSQKNYLFLLAIEGKEFDINSDFKLETERWRLNVLLLDANEQMLALFPAEKIELGQSPKYIKDRFPHITEWDYVFWANFGPKNQALEKQIKTVRLLLSSQDGSFIQLDFPATNIHTY